MSMFPFYEPTANYIGCCMFHKVFSRAVYRTFHGVFYKVFYSIYTVGRSIPSAIGSSRRYIQGI